ncbi:MAG: acyl carrier protein [Oscillospiraceae bacterium]|nr:acyl carrier protein [Oscillospiraceae bacterium]
MRSFEQHLYEVGYSRQQEITFQECDRNKQIRIGALLSVLALYGGYDYDARGLTHDKLADLHYVFLLSRAAIKIHRRPVNREVLTVDTWEDGSRGPHFRRVYRMSDDAGNVLVSAKGDWLLVDPASRKIERPSAFKARAIPASSGQEIDCPEPKKIRLPSDGLQDLGERPIRWSDLDGNGHLYSGNYGDIVWDFLPPDLQSRPVDAFFINYSREVTLGDSLRLTGFSDGNAYRIQGYGPAELCFTAECAFSD